MSFIRPLIHLKEEQANEVVQCFVVISAIVLATAIVVAQPPRLIPVVSPEVGANHAVTFRVRAPHAESVRLGW